MDFQIVRPDLNRVLRRFDRARSGRPQTDGRAEVQDPGIPGPLRPVRRFGATVAEGRVSREKAKIGLTNLADNLHGLIWREARPVPT